MFGYKGKKMFGVILIDSMKLTKLIKPLFVLLVRERKKKVEKKLIVCLYCNELNYIKSINRFVGSYQQGSRLLMASRFLISFALVGVVAWPYTSARVFYLEIKSMTKKKQVIVNVS